MMEHIKPLNIYAKNVANICLFKVNNINLKEGVTYVKLNNKNTKICFICFIESPLKVMKNDFYFILKALFVLKIFKFLS